MIRIDTSVKLHPKVRRAVEETATDLGVNMSWVIEAALVEYMRNKLPAGFMPGMPTKDHANDH